MFDRVRIVLACFIVLCAAYVCSADNWLSFATDGKAFVMEFTDTGDILIPPTVVDDTLSSANTALTPYSQDLALWVITFDSTSGYDSVIRMIVDSDTLQASPKTNFLYPAYILKYNRTLSSSQNMNNQFLVMRTKTSLKGFGLNSQAKADGRSFRVSPRTDVNFMDAGVSSDGRIAWTIAPNSFPDSKLYLQALKADGTPTGDPFVIFGSAQNLLLDADVSNPLPGNKRFAAYTTYTTSGNLGSVFVQPVNASTGQKMGSVRTVATGFPASDSGPFGTMAVDPNGHFVLYAANDPGCPTEFLWFQAIDATGNATGAPKILVECNIDPASHSGVIGVDIMKAQ